jgi:copper transport protein
VGNANAAAVSAIQQSTSFRLPFSTLISKFLMLASLALLVGQQLFTALVWTPALKTGQEDGSPILGRPPVWDRLYRAGLIMLLISVGLGILGQAGQSTGSELVFPWSFEMGTLLTETRLGMIWLARLALAIAAVWLNGRKESPLRDWSALLVNLALLFTVTLTSHAPTEARPTLPVLADWIHLVGMTFWLGGLVYFFTAVRHLRQLDGRLRTRLTSFLAGRFSFLALIFVGLIGLTGVYSATLRVGSVPGLLDSLYGHVMLVKQAFVAGLLVIAATNLLVISPRLKRDRLQGSVTEGLVERFGKLLILELTLAGLLLASVSLLTYLPPAGVASPVSDFTGIKQVDDIKVELNISPARVGQNTFMLMLISSDGHPIPNAKKVLLRFTSSQANIPPSELEMIGDGSGMYMAKGTYLSLPGKWQVQAVVRRGDKFDAFANFDLALRAPGSVDKNAASAKATGGLLVSIALLAALTTIGMPAHPRIRFGLGIPLILLVIGLGVYYLARPIPVEAAQVNPIPANPESVEAGANVYSVNCAPCHGVSGKGDGPVGLALNPRPADLTQHAIPGVHTDAQLFEWITNGFPGSRMPAFKSTLSDTDRWNLVNFIRTLAPR